jgi:starch synthase (maltosyl-transferring)
MTAEKPTELSYNPHMPLSQALLLPRIVIENIMPTLEGGQFAVKAVAGQDVVVTAKVFADGHDKLAVRVRWRAEDEDAWRSATMNDLGNNGWQGQFRVDSQGRYLFCIEAWIDQFASFCYELEKKHAAAVPVSLELQEGRTHVQQAAERSEGQLSEQLAALHHELSGLLETEQIALFLHPRSADLMAQVNHRAYLSLSPEYPVDVERELAQFASWYELFPRSITDSPARHGTFNDVHSRLAMIHDMGFDVLYFPPIHPIGLANRKGRNNTLTAQPGDVGSPYAIGAAEGGHTAVHPQLGTLDDFKAMLAAAHAHGLEIALDFAIQCSPDHPWLKEHPTWFAWRPDGTLRYAENPPKKYQDIVNPDFYAHDAKPDLWLALRDVILFWIEAGVKIFRVDNPHTKPLPFWEWMIGDVRARYPDTIFLAEAFTRPRMMNRLGKIGFSQSYTYFTWRESKRDFIEYMNELTKTDARDFYRPNFFVNTPDINPRHLQSQGRSGFLIRAALASTLAGLWGVYSGFELCEAAALPNSEEYLDSEKYQLRAWDWNRPGNITGEITALNRIRRANPALQTHLGLTFLTAHNDHILLFEKATEARDNVIVVAINLDAFNEQGADIELSWDTFQRWHLHDHGALEVTDQMTGARFEWHGRWQHVQLGSGQPFSIWRIAPLGGLPAERPDDADSDPDSAHHADAGNPTPTEGAT